MLKLALLTLAFVAISLALLSVRIILVRGGRFRSMHIGASAAMRKRGIHCVQSMDAMERKENPNCVAERAADQKKKNTTNNENKK